MRITRQTVRRTSTEILGMKGLSNRFHVVVCLFSNRSQMTGKCGKNKKGHPGSAEFVTYVLTTF